MLDVVFLDELHAQRLHNPSPGGYDVRALPSGIPAQQGELFLAGIIAK
jgi:hypothetical protein